MSTACATHPCDRARLQLTAAGWHGPPSHILPRAGGRRRLALWHQRSIQHLNCRQIHMESAEELPASSSLTNNMQIQVLSDTRVFPLPATDRYPGRLKPVGYRPGCRKSPSPCSTPGICGLYTGRANSQATQSRVRSKRRTVLSVHRSLGIFPWNLQTAIGSGAKCCMKDMPKE